MPREEKLKVYVSPYQYNNTVVLRFLRQRHCFLSQFIGTPYASHLSMTPEIRIGISGWTYSGWRGTFYPSKLPHAQELPYASRKVNSIEVNGTFYALQSPETYEKWYASVPDDFIFSIKASRFITHVRRLNNIDEPLARFFKSGVLGLDEKLGPILWQFPPNMKYDKNRFGRFLDLLAKHSRTGKKVLRHAIEVRNESFRNPQFIAQLKDHRAALVMSHSSDAWPYFEEKTADFAYARLHGEGKLYSGGYGNRALNDWAKKIRKWSCPQKPRDFFLYFDNDVKVRAPFDAMDLSSRLGLDKSLRAA
jgi:uncharacterized protein YecE (DUF72 family)